MATFSPLSIFIILCSLPLHFIVASSSVQFYPEMTLTLVNNCPFTICPAIQPDSGHPVLERGGFCLQTLTHRSFSAPRTPWSGRIWARTGCTHHHSFTCATGDCGSRLECLGLGGAPPATLAQVSLHHGGPHLDLTSYGVSVVDGFNLPLTVTPHEGRGRCPVVGCRDQNLLAACPGVLQFRARNGDGGGAVVGCKSGCGAFGTDELCCRNMYNNPKTCRASTYSEFFKSRCPATFTYAHDTPSLSHHCSAPKELKLIFCH